MIESEWREIGDLASDFITDWDVGSKQQRAKETWNKSLDVLSTNLAEWIQEERLSAEANCARASSSGIANKLLVLFHHRGKKTAAKK